MQASNHAAKAVASYALPEQTCQLRISVGYINGFLLAVADIVESGYALSECEERLVDLDAFLLRLASDGRQTLSLTTCKVHQLQLRQDHVVWVRGVNLLESESEQGVRPT